MYTTVPAARRSREGSRLHDHDRIELKSPCLLRVIEANLKSIVRPDEGGVEDDRLHVGARHLHLDMLVDEVKGLGPESMPDRGRRPVALQSGSKLRALDRPLVPGTISWLLSRQ